MEAPVTLFRVYLGMVTCFRARLCWGGGGNVTFLGIYGFPLYCSRNQRRMSCNNAGVHRILSLLSSPKQRLSPAH